MNLIIWGSNRITNRCFLFYKDNRNENLIHNRQIYKIHIYTYTFTHLTRFTP